MSEPSIVYESDRVTLWHGDCREVLARIGQGDHVITDPPYDTRTHAGARSLAAPSEPFIDFDPIDPAAVAPLLTLAARRWVIAFCALEQLGAYSRAVGDRWVRACFWHRPDGAPQITGDRPAQPGEGIAVWHASSGRMRWNGGGHRGFYSCGVVRGHERVHPTQKPLGLLSALVNQFTDPGDLIVDPFAGSGTLGVAAVALGRRAVLIEARRAHCDSAARRLSLVQPDLFTEAEDRSC